MVHGFPVLHVLLLIVFLISIALPFLLVAHARHAKWLMAATMLLTVIVFVLSWLFGSHVSDRLDQVLLRCYAFSSVLCSLADKSSSSARTEEMPTRFNILLPLFLLFTLVCLIGGISGKF
jgi:hypothetical protein